MRRKLQQQYRVLCTLPEKKHLIYLWYNKKADD